MTETSERYRRVADAFTDRVAAVPADAWDRPAPCEGWVARDVVQHMVDTSGFFLGRAGLDLPVLPAVADDPMGAWTGARDAVLGALDDPGSAAIEIDGGPIGTLTLEEMVAAFGVADILIHTWDLSRAVGLDERLDPEEVRRVHEALLPRDEMMRGPAFGPKVEVPDDADEQTRLIGFTGRTP